MHLGREAAVPEIRAPGRETSRTHADVLRRQAVGHLDPVPVDPEGRREPHLPLARAQHAGEIDRNRLRPPDGDPDVDRGAAPPAAGGTHLEQGHHRGDARLVGRHVVARERVVGPPGQEQRRRAARLSEIERQGVLAGIAAELREREPFGVAAVEPGDAVRDVAARVVDGPDRRADVPHRVEAVRLGRGRHPLVRVHLHVARMRQRQQLELVDEQHLLQLVRHPQLEAALARAELVAPDADVLDGIGRVVDARPVPVAHLAAAQEIGHEDEPLAVPGEEDGAGRRLAVELLHGQRRRQNGWRPGRNGRLRGGVDRLGGGVGGRLGLEDPRGPEHPDDVGALAGSEPEHQVGGRHGGRRGRGLEPGPQAARAHLHLRAHARPIAGEAGDADSQRIVARIAAVHEQGEPAGVARREVAGPVSGEVGHHCGVRGPNGADRRRGGGEPCRPRDVRPCSPEIAEQAGAVRQPREQVGKPVVVVVHESRRRRAGRIRPRLHGEPAPPVALRDDEPRRPGEEQVGVVVLVHVAGRGGADRAGCRAHLGQPHLPRHLPEGAVPQVGEEPRPGRVIDDQEVDVARVVEVGRHDRDDPPVRLQPGLGRDVLEGAVLVVAQQPQRSRGELVRKQHRRVRRGAGGGEVGQPGQEDVDVAVVIDVGEGRGARQGRVRRQAGVAGDVVEAPRPVVAVEAAASVTQHEQVGRQVVVEVGRDGPDAHRPGRGGAEPRRLGHVGPLARAVVAQQLLSLGRHAQEVEVAVAVRVERRDPASERRGQGAGPAGVELRRGEAASERRGRRVVRREHEIERYRREGGGGWCGIDELRLGARRRDGPRVAALLEVARPVGDRVAARPQRLRLLEQRAPLVRLAAAGEGQPQVVDRGDVERLGVRGQAQARDRGRVVARLELDLPQVDVRADIGGILLEDLLEPAARILRTVLRAGDQSEQVRRLQRPRQALGRHRGLAPGSFQILVVEQGQGEVEAGDRERVPRRRLGRARAADRRADGQRLAERRRGRRVVELLQARDAPVVGPVGRFAQGQRIRTVRGATRRPGRRQHPRSAPPRDSRHRCSPPMASDATSPSPSRTVRRRFAGVRPRRSTCPLGQVTRTESTASARPRPKVSGSSLCEA